MEHEPIAIVGLGAFYPGARNARELWENVLARRCEFRRIPDCRLPPDYMDADPAAADKTYATRAAVIDGFVFDWAARRVPRTTFESTDVVHWLALEVALAALADAGYARDRLPSDTTGVIVGNTLTGEQMRSQALRARWPFVERALVAALAAHGLSGRDAAAIAATAEQTMKSALAATTEDTLAGGLSNTIAGRICTALGVHGGGYTVDGACSSSLLAVATAAAALERGDLDVALAGGVDVSIDPFELVSFAKTGALAAGDMNVYDRRASGFIPGEGCGFVVLRRLADARAAGDRVYAVLHGWGISSDGRGGITAPDRDGQALAIERAYARAGYSAATLSFVEGHGTGTVVGDRVEILAVETTLRRAGVAPRTVGITSLKSIVGHTKAAAGVGGLIKAAIAVNRRVIPATAGCTEPNATFEADAPSVYPILQGEIRPEAATLRAGVSAMGFGGINCHVTVESADPPDDRVAPAGVSERSLLASSQATELFVLAADDPRALVEEANRLAAAARGASVGDLVDLSAMMAARARTGNARGAIVASTPDDLVARANEFREVVAAAGCAAHGVAMAPTRRVWAGLGARRARVGFLFPGQGSQVLGMARRLVERHAWAAEWLARSDRWLEREGAESLGSIMFPPVDRATSPQELAAWQGRLAATENAQPAICLASVLWLCRLRELGVEPDAVGGHSLGELTAFYAAGAFDEATLLKLAALRGRAMAAPPEQAGAMLSLRCDRTRAEALAARAGGYVVVANLNSPSQTVVSGERVAIVRVEQIAAAEGISARRLPVSNAFHSRLVEGAGRILRERADLPDTLRATRARLVSGVPGAQVDGSLSLREHFVRQLTSPVDFVSITRNLAASVDVLVELGPGGVLSSLVRDTIGDVPPAVAVESQAGRDADLNTSLAALHAAGVPMARAGRLCDDRLVRPFREAASRQFIVNPCELPMRVPADVRPVRSAEYTRLESAIAAATGLSAERLSKYLEQRTPFLAGVVRADVESLAGLGDLPEAQSPAVETPPPASEPRAAEAPVETVGQIAAVIADLVARRTGYPRASIQPSLRLSQDLALDSIKGAEIVAEAARRLGVAGKIEPAAFLGSRIDQIAEALHEARAAWTAREEPDSWVRDFVIERWAEEPPASDASASLRSARVCIVAGPAEEPIAAALRETIGRAGADVSAAPTAGARWSHCIVILPRYADVTASPAERLRTMIDRIGLDALRDEAIVGDRRTVAFVQFGGGHFGAEEAPADPDVACATAFAASLHLERPGWRVRAIDFSADTGPGYVAEAVAAELQTPGAWALAGYDRSLRRRVPRPRLLDTAALPPRDISWHSDEVMLVTGGGRGITAECAFALASETGLRAVLVGRTPHPDVAAAGAPLEVAQTLKRFEDAGLTVRYASCDVTDPAAVAALVADVRANVGPIALLVHGSAQNVPRRIERVSSEDAFAEVAPKVLGAMHLLDALRDAPPKLVVALTSAIGVSGMPGNASYGFSNEAVSALLGRFEADHPDSATLAVAFSVWKEIGMGARMGSIATLASLGVGAVPRADAVAHFLRLVDRRPRSHQVVVAARLGLDTWQPRRPPKPAASHFLQAVLQHEPDVEVIARTHLHPSRDPYLADHVFRGAYLFPTVFGLEAMAQAVALAIGTIPDAFAIEAIALPRPIVVDPDRGTTIEVRALVLEERDPEGHRRISAEVRTESTGFERAHFSAEFVLGADTTLADPKPIDVPPARLDIDPDRDLYGGLLFQGERFHRLGAFRQLDRDGCIFELRPAQALDADGRFVDGELGPLLLGDPYARDALLQSAQTIVPDDVCLPVRIDRIEFCGGPRRPPAFGEFRLLYRDGGDLTGRVQAIDDEGRTVERMAGYVVHVLEARDDRERGGPPADTSADDVRHLRAVLERWSAASQLDPVSIALEHVVGLDALSREQRHERERPIVERALKRAVVPAGAAGVRIEWLESGRPVVPGGLEVSITHDRDTCVVVAGSGPQGCDLASVDRRSRREWLALLGELRAPLVESLLAGGDSLDAAGTRVWSAAEAARKASGAARIDLFVQERRRASVLFRCAASEREFHVLTAPVRLRGRDRLWAVVVRTA